MVRSKKVLVFLLAVVFCLSLSTMWSVTETNASGCYRLDYSWDCITWYSTLVYLYPDFTFQELYGGFGDWGMLDSKSTYLQFWDGCQELYAGTKKQGFFQCTDGSQPGKDYYPGCWYLKKSKDC